MPIGNNNRDPYNNGYTNQRRKKMDGVKLKLWGGIGVLAAVIFMIVAYQFIGFAEVKGHQAAVVEKFYGDDKGVQTALLNNGRHFYVPAFSKPYIYNVGTDNFIMGDSKYYSGKGTDFTDFNALTIKCGGRGNEQPATFSVTLQFHLDTRNLATLHKSAQHQYKDRIIKPALTNIIKSLTVEQHVLDFYTGIGYNKLQRDIQAAIKVDPTLSEVGIVVDTFVLDQIDLDPEYEAEIQGRQLATQKKLRADEEAKAAESLALKAQAVANAKKLERIVAAEADKQEKIKAAEASNESRILAAKAEAAEIKQKAGAERYRKEQDAKGLLAQGLAQARVDKERKISRYEGISGKRQALVEMTQAKVEMFKNFNPDAVITEKTFLTVLREGQHSNNSPTVTIEANQ